MQGSPFCSVYKTALQIYLHTIHTYFCFSFVGLFLDLTLKSCEYYQHSVLDMGVTNPISDRAFAPLFCALCLDKLSQKSINVVQTFSFFIIIISVMKFR